MISAWRMAQDFSRRFDPVETWELNRHQDDIRRLLSADLYRIGPALCFSHYLKLSAVPKDGLDSISHDPVFVNKENL
jgi:hypothetical protein